MFRDRSIQGSRYQKTRGTLSVYRLSHLHDYLHTTVLCLAAFGFVRG